MNVRISKPLGFSKLGERTNNEDAIFPDPNRVTPLQRWFMVCDGVGGTDRGEVASQMAITYLDDFFRHRPDQVATEAFVQQAVTYVEDSFNRYLSINEQAVGMGTTMTLLFLHEAGATVAHIGDSRVYHFRAGKVEWCTEDHSYVNELVKGGVLSVAEARQHPQRNIITRALQGGQNRVKPSVQIINDLRPGDYFLLCSDGLLERVSDELLERTIGGPESDEEKINTLLTCCEGHTRDNFTAYLIHIESISGDILPSFKVEKPVYERHQAPTDEAITLISAPLTETGYPSDVETRELIDRRAKTDTRPEKIAESVPTGYTSQAKSARSSATGWWLWLVSGLFLVVAVYFGRDVFWKIVGSREKTAGEQTRIQTGASDNETRKKSVTPAKSSLSSAAESTDNVTEEDLTIYSKDLEVGKKLSSQVYIGRNEAGQLGLLKKNRKSWLIEPQFSHIGDFENGLAPATKNGTTKFLTEDGHVYDEKGELNCSRILVRKGNQYGFLNRNGQITIGLRYSAAASFDDECTAVVEQNGKSFRIDSKGNTVK